MSKLLKEFMIPSTFEVLALIDFNKANICEQYMYMDFSYQKDVSIQSMTLYHMT